MNNTYILSSIQDGVELLHSRLSELPRKGTPLLLAIDGRCASGKTTLSDGLSRALSCPVIHMDHFFLPPTMRTPERLSQPGGNVDRERFLQEVLTPLTDHRSFAYRPYECHRGDYGCPIEIPLSPVVIIEGSYACHPNLSPAYDLRVFMTVSLEIQTARILKRNGEAAARIFADRWIPLEEKYFSVLHPAESCEMVFDTTFT